MLKLSKKLETSTGHRLPNHKGGCSRLHGHNYTIYVTIGWEENNYIDNKDGFYIDFGDIKRIIIDEIDHRYLLYKHDPFLKMLRDLPGVKIVEFIPTAENISKHLIDMIRNKFNSIDYIKIIIYETSRSKAIREWRKP